MTEWWISTSMVMKVRARSSAAFRVLAFGAARIPAGASELEMDVMRAPAGWSFQMLPPGTRFSKGHPTKCRCDSAKRPPGDDPGPSGFHRKKPANS
jgi:hypothetical protein